MNIYRRALFWVLVLGIWSNSAHSERNTDLAATDYKFKVFLDKRAMGYHFVKLRQEDDQLKISIKADFSVKFLVFSAFSYHHATEEVWSDGCLLSIDATTDNDGEALFVKGRQQGKTFKLESHQGKSQLQQECVHSFAYWNKDLLNANALLNSQTGDYEEATFKSLGTETLVINEKPFTSEKYLLTAKDKEILLWYDSNDKWIALESETEDEYTIRYFTAAAYE